MFIMRAHTDHKRSVMSRFFTRYFTSVLIFMFALPIGTLLFGGFGSGRGFAAGAAVATICAIFTYIFWPKLKDNSVPGQDSSGTSQDSSE